jgi:hypothetical protein
MAAACPPDEGGEDDQGEHRGSPALRRVHTGFDERQVALRDAGDHVLWVPSGDGDGFRGDPRGLAQASPNGGSLDLQHGFRAEAQQVVGRFGEASVVLPLRLAVLG